MHPAAVQALVCLPLVPAAALLLHHGIARDERRWRRAQLADRMTAIRHRYLAGRRGHVSLRLFADTRPFVEAARRAQEAINLMSGRLQLLAQFAAGFTVKPRPEDNR